MSKVESDEFGELMNAFSSLSDLSDDDHTIEEIFLRYESKRKNESKRMERNFKKESNNERMCSTYKKLNPEALPFDETSDLSLPIPYRTRSKTSNPDLRCDD